jgi:hypothetical protein
LFSIDKV